MSNRLTGKYAAGATAFGILALLGAGLTGQAQAADTQAAAPAPVPVNSDAGHDDVVGDLAGAYWEEQPAQAPSLAPRAGLPSSSPSPSASAAPSPSAAPTVPPVLVPPVPVNGDPWPTAQSMLDRLNSYGITPIVQQGYDKPGWERHAHLDQQFTPMNAFMIHDTGTSVPASRLNQAHSLNWIMTGNRNSDGEVVRAANLYVDRAGLVYVIYLHRTWHAGKGDPMFGIPEDRMNGYAYGMEIESQGGGVQDLTPEQINSAAKVAAAGLDVAGLPTDRAINHKDYAGRKQGKVDTAYDISYWRTLIDAARSGNPNPVTVAAPVFVAPPVSPDPLAISMAYMKLGKSGPYVSRYQSALRAFAKRLGIKGKRLRAINPSGATGLYGNETRKLTKNVLRELAQRKSVWSRSYAVNPKTYPTAALIKRIGRHAIP